MKSNPFSVAELLTWINHRLSKSIVEEWPFRHVLVENFLPPIFFDHLVRNLPRLSAYDRPESQGTHPAGERAVISLCTAKRTAATSNFALSSLAELSESREFSQLFTELLLGSSQLPLAHSPQGFLSRDFPPYEIGPHTDIPKRLVSAILYIGEKDQRHSWGTTLFVPINPEFRCRNGSHYDFQGFRPVRSLEFRANRLFAFPRSDISFHGLMPMPRSVSSRDTWLYEVVKDETGRMPGAK